MKKISRDHFTIPSDFDNINISILKQYKCTLVKYSKVTAAVAATSTAVVAVRKISPICNPVPCKQLFQLRLSPRKAEKSNTSAKSLLGIAKKLTIF